MSKYNIELVMHPNDSHTKILERVVDNSAVLEFGPAHGVMSRYMKEQLGCKIYAVELDAEAAEEAKQYCEKIIIDNIETCSWQNEFANMQFDYIIFADVLEHLYDPWKVLREVKRFLKPDGHILISLPNIANNAIIMNLIQDKFEYQSVGLLDNTHIRFFTKASIDSMVSECGYKTSGISAVFSQPQNTEFHQYYSNFNSGVVDTLINKSNGHVYQFIYEIIHVENTSIECNNGTDLTEPSNVDIFYDTGSGFNSQENIKILKSSDSGVVPLRTDKPIQGIRIDPSDNSGKLHAAKFYVTDHEGNELDCKIRSFVGFDFLINGVNICFGNDPQIILDLPIQNPISLIYKFSYENIFLSNNDVIQFRLIHDLQNTLSSTQSELSSTQSELSSTQSELSSTKNELRACYHSRSWILTKPLRGLGQIIKKSKFNI